MTILDLRFIVLKGLSKKRMSGYDLIKSIKEDIGWKPSPGSMYPLLKKLIKEKIVIKKEERCNCGCNKNKIMYSLTSKGKRELNILDKKRVDVVDHLKKDVNIAEKVLGFKTKVKPVMTYLNQIRKGKLPFGKATEDLIELRDVLLDISDKDKFKKNEDKVKNIIKKTIKELKTI